MKQTIDKKEIQEFEERYKKITKIVGDGIRDGKADPKELLNTLSQSNYATTFLDNLSSGDTFDKNYNFISNAFDHRNNSKLINRIHEHKRKRRMHLFATVVGSAAAILALTFWVLNDDRKEPLVAEIEEITVPTLFIADHPAIHLELGEHTIVAKEYATAKSEDKNEQVEEIIENIQQRLVIPNGHTYTVILDDGTEVTLNANSELRYPTRFNGEVRKVFLKGEGFFKVKKDEKPFIVNSYEVDVKVYGTMFNLKAKDASKIEAVLVEGSVGVTIHGEKEVKMQPNQLFSYDRVNSISDLKNVDASRYTQWIDGNFNYDDYPLRDVLNDLEAWYDVDFEMIDKIGDTKITFFSPKEQDISKVLRVIEIVTNVKFIKEGGRKYSINR